MLALRGEADYYYWLTIWAIRDPPISDAQIMLRVLMDSPLPVYRIFNIGIWVGSTSFLDQKGPNPIPHGKGLRTF